MNMFKKNGGFTLVELIVVIAILAILAGVAVPVYSGYISKANEAADYTALDAVKTAAAFAYTEQQVANGDNDVSITQLDVTAGSNEVTVNSTTDVNVSAYCTVPDEFKSGATSATWTSAGWELN